MAPPGNAQAPPSTGIHSLATIIKRLEAATSRLEDIALSSAAASSAPQTTSRSQAPTSSTHEAIAGHVSGGAPPPPPPPPAPPAPAAEPEKSSSPAVKAYEDEFINGVFQDFLAKSKEAGGPVAEQAQLVQKLLQEQLNYLTFASTYAKPSSSAAKLLEPQSKAIGAILEHKEQATRAKNGRDWVNQLTAVAEGVSAFGWVQVEPAPAPFVAEMKNAAQFYLDRVIKVFKETDPKQVAWARSTTVLLDALQKYVKQWHTTGVTWNPKGSAAPSTISAVGSAAPAAGGPPPPPPPPPPPAADAPAPASSGASPAAALLADLNKGGAVTSGLRKVDPSQMTHKNPSLRAGSTVPDSSSKKVPAVPAKPAGLARAPSAVKKNPAKTELEGTKWLVEYHENKNDIIIEDTELQQTVHLYGLKKCVVRIGGKVNAISLVNCHKTAVVLDSAVSQLSITSSPSFEIQITGIVPIITIDTTDSGQIYLSKACMDTIEVVTSKTSSINISVPSGEDGDFVEKPVPEQMKTVVQGGKLVTTIVEHAG